MSLISSGILCAARECVLDIKWPSQNISHHNSLSSCICIEVLGFRFNATGLIDERCICYVGNNKCV